MSRNDAAGRLIENDRVAGACVVIIGGGVTGLSTAFWLADAGVNVLVLERGVAGWEASGRNGGGCTHPQSPLFKEEQRLWPMMDEILGYPTEFQPKRIRMALTPQQFELYSRSVRNSQQQGFEVDALDAKQVRELVPLAGDTAYAGHLYHFGGHANPHRTVQAYAWALADRGGRLRQHVAVTGFTTAGCHVTGVQTDKGTFSCDHVLIAAGPQTGRLAGQLGVTIPLRTARAEMIVTEPLPMMPIGGVDGAGLYGRQTLRGNLAYGGGPHEWVETEEMPTPNRPSTPLAGHIAHRVVQLFPKAAHAKVIRSWAGIIENTPDGRPILDQPEPWQNLTVATMSGVGFGLSPATGRALMQLITQRFCDFADLSTLRLERFVDLEPNWDELQGWLPAKVAAA
jgi:sarcosine oxidase subunit beta